MTKVVFVTGAATGIGHATVERLHRKGCKLALFDVQKDKIDALASRLGPEVITFAGSVTEAAEIEAAMAETARRFGQIDVLWANAGIAKVVPTVCMDEEDWKRIIDVNLSGTFRTVKAATPYLMESRGYVLVTSSITSAFAFPFGGAYVASKAGVLNFAEAYRIEMRGWGIEVGTLHPTFITTPMVTNEIHGEEMGQLVAGTSRLLFLEFPVSWASWSAARMILKRKRRDTVPSVTHLPFIWFPRFATWFSIVWAFRAGKMRRLVERAVEITRAKEAGDELGR